MKNFNCFEQQALLSVGPSSIAKSFQSAIGQTADDCMVVNCGTNGAQINFGPVGIVALNTAAASGTKQVFIAAGASMFISKNGAQWFAAITDSGATNLIFHAGSKT